MTTDPSFGDEARDGRQMPPGFEDPTVVIFEQDASFTGGQIDYKRWSDTIFFPLVMFCDGHSLIAQDHDAFIAHLKEIKEMAGELGMSSMRTRILSQLRPVEDMAIISSIRDRLDKDGQVLASASMTWSIIRVSGAWKINQIHFNDCRYDLSVVAHMLRKSGET